MTITLPCRDNQDMNLKNRPDVFVVRLAPKLPKEGEVIEQSIPFVDVTLCLDKKEAADFVVGNNYLITIEETK